AAGTRRLDPRRDLLLLFSISKQSAFAGMRIDGSNTDSRPRNTRTNESFMATHDGALHQSRFDLCNSVDQSDVGGHVDDSESGRGQHHRHFLGARKVSKKLRMSGELSSRSMQRLLVQRRGADALGPAVHRELGGNFDVLKGGLTSRR